MDDTTFLARKGDVTLHNGPVPRLIFEMMLRAPQPRAIQVVSYQCEVLLGKELLNSNFLGRAHLEVLNSLLRLQAGTWVQWYFYLPLEESLVRTVEKFRTNDLTLGLRLSVVGFEIEGEAIQRPYFGQPTNEADTSWMVVHYRIAESDWKKILDQIGYQPALPTKKRSLSGALRLVGTSRLMTWLRKAVRFGTATTRRMITLMIIILGLVGSIVTITLDWDSFSKLLPGWHVFGF